MSNHTGTMGACQDYAHDPRPESTPSHSHSSPDSIDRRLIHRYGVALLTGGYTALPTYAWVYYARLGVSEAEMVCLAQLCTYWWSARDPYPGEAALATRMGKTVRTIQGYLRALEGKGLLHIQTRLSHNGRQSTNAYDLRPFFAAVEGRARLDGLLDDDAAPMAPAPRDNGSCHRPQSADDTDSCDFCIRQGHVAQVPDESYADHPTAPDADATISPCIDASVSPPVVCNMLLPLTDSCDFGPFDDNHKARESAERGPLCAGVKSNGPENIAKANATADPRRGEEFVTGGAKDSSPQVNPIEIENFDFDSIPPTPAKATLTTKANESHAQADDAVNDQTLAVALAALSAALGDDAPRSSLGRARNLCRDAGVSLDHFLRLLDEAAARTRDRQASIVKRRRDGQTPNGMPYLFAVLQDLLHPTPPRAADVGPVTDRRRAGQPGRRRRQREGGCGEPISSYAAWSDSPAPLPIVEEHPVWRAVLDELAQVMTPENFNAWLASTRALDQDGEVLRVAVPAAFNQTWLEHKLAGKVMGTLHKIDYDALAIGRVGRVEYVVDPAACAPIEAAAQAS